MTRRRRSTTAEVEAAKPDVGARTLAAALSEEHVARLQKLRDFGDQPKEAGDSDLGALVTEEHAAGVSISGLGQRLLQELGK